MQLHPLDAGADAVRDLQCSAGVAAAGDTGFTPGHMPPGSGRVVVTRAAGDAMKAGGPDARGTPTGSPAPQEAATFFHPSSSPLESNSKTFCAALPLAGEIFSSIWTRGIEN